MIQNLPARAARQNFSKSACPGAPPLPAIISAIVQLQRTGANDVQTDVSRALPVHQATTFPPDRLRPSPSPAPLALSPSPSADRALVVLEHERRLEAEMTRGTVRGGPVKPRPERCPGQGRRSKARKNLASKFDQTFAWLTRDLPDQNLPFSRDQNPRYLRQLTRQRTRTNLEPFL